VISDFRAIESTGKTYRGNLILHGLAASWLFLFMVAFGTGTTVLKGFANPNQTGIIGFRKLRVTNSATMKTPLP